MPETLPGCVQPWVGGAGWVRASNHPSPWPLDQPHVWRESPNPPCLTSPPVQTLSGFSLCRILVAQGEGLLLLLDHTAFRLALHDLSAWIEPAPCDQAAAARYRHLVVNPAKTAGTCGASRSCTVQRGVPVSPCQSFRPMRPSVRAAKRLSALSQNGRRVSPSQGGTDNRRVDQTRRWWGGWVLTPHLRRAYG